MSSSVLFVDTETTGLERPEIVQFAHTAVNWHRDPLRIDPGPGPYGSFCLNYRPSGPVSLGALATHHLLPSDLEGGPPSSEARLPDAAKVIIGHNVDYDWEALGRPNVRRICTLALARKYYPELDSHSLSALMYHFQGITEETRAMLKEAHNAAFDVKHNIVVLSKMLEDRIQAQSVDHLWELSEDARVPDVILFGKHRGERFEDIPVSYLEWILRQTEMDPYVQEAARRALGI